MRTCCVGASTAGSELLARGHVVTAESGLLVTHRRVAALGVLLLLLLVLLLLLSDRSFLLLNAPGASAGAV